MKKNSKFSRLPAGPRQRRWQIPCLSGRQANSKKNPKSKIQNSKLDEEEVGHIAKLARLKLTREEVKMFCFQLSEVLEYMKVLNEVETGGVEPTAQVTGLENVFREDEVSPSLEPNEALSCAPAREGNFFKTGVVLEK